jgi:hypothetical protein
MTKSNLKALNAYFRAKSLTYFFLRSLQMDFNFAVITSILIFLDFLSLLGFWWYEKRKSRIYVLMRMGIPKPEPHFISGQISEFFAILNLKFHIKVTKK